MDQQKINRKKMRENNDAGKRGHTGRQQSDLQQTADYSLKGSQQLRKLATKKKKKQQ